MTILIYSAASLFFNALTVSARRDGPHAGGDDFTGDVTGLLQPPLHQMAAQPITVALAPAGDCHTTSTHADRSSRGGRQVSAFNDRRTSGGAGVQRAGGLHEQALVLLTWHVELGVDALELLVQLPQMAAEGRVQHLHSHMHVRVWSKLPRPLLRTSKLPAPLSPHMCIGMSRLPYGWKKGCMPWSFGCSILPYLVLFELAHHACHEGLGIILSTTPARGTETRRHNTIIPHLHIGGIDFPMPLTGPGLSKLMHTSFTPRT